MQMVIEGDGGSQEILESRSVENLIGDLCTVSWIQVVMEEASLVDLVEGVGRFPIL